MSFNGGFCYIDISCISEKDAEKLKWFRLLDKSASNTSGLEFLIKR